MATPTQAIGDLLELCELNIPAVMLGGPGSGKSAITREVAKQYGGGYIDFRASLRDPVDINGLPVPNKEAGYVDWLPTGDLPRADRDGPTGILHLDEVTDASKQMQSALYGLVLDRRVGSYEMPEGWRIVACGNRIEDRAAAGRLTTALANRFNHVDLEQSVDDWIKWAIRAKIAPELLAFMRFRPELLSDFDPDRKKNATPRTWGEQISPITLKKLPKDREARLIYNAINESAAIQYTAFLETWRDLPNPDSVLMNPTGAPVPDTSAGKWAISGAVSRRVREGSLDAMVTYMKRLPSEFGIMAMNDAIERAPEFASTSAYIEWVAENQDFYL